MWLSWGVRTAELKGRRTMARGTRPADDDDWRGEAVVKAERVPSAMMMLIRDCRTGTGVDHIVVNVRVGNTTR